MKNGIELTPQQTLDLGIEIVAAMHASAYDLSIEDGRLMALEDTEFDPSHEDANPESEHHQNYMNFVERQKKRLHEQANFVASIALEKLKTLSQHA